MFALAPRRQATSHFWRSIYSAVPPHFANRWPWYVGAWLAGILLAEAFLQLVVAH
jgi:hypothetical protein